MTTATRRRQQGREIQCHAPLRYDDLASLGAGVRTLFEVMAGDETDFWRRHPRQFIEHVRRMVVGRGYEPLPSQLFPELYVPAKPAGKDAAQA